jgi:peptide/nickel transport system permease protein
MPGIFGRLSSEDEERLSSPRSLGPTRQAVRRFFKQPLGVTGLAILILEVILAALAPYVAPGSPTDQVLSQKLKPPSWEHPMGTDNLGRDVLSRVIYGARNTLGGSLLALLILTTMGIFIGGLAGFAGGLIDMILMRMTDALLSFPYLVLALGLAAAFSPSLLTVVIAVSFTWWGHYARVIRGMVMGIREMVYVEASRAVGAGNIRLMRRHILPNVMAPILVLSSLDLGLIVLAVAALSYLGLGIQPPSPEWGMMLNESRLFMFMAPHIMIFPGLMIFITVLAANLLGDALRDAFDPKQSAKGLV